MTSVSDAILAFRLREGLAADGGDSRRIDWVKAFGVPFPIPNTALRKPIVPYHDLHHLLCGYATDEAGEGEISAWTLATGGGPLVGRVYDLAAFLVGFVRFPRRCAAAFQRGRVGRNLYRRPLQYWLDQDLEALVAWSGVAEPPPPPTLLDRLALVRVIVLALAVWGSGLGFVVLAATVAWDVWLWLRGRDGVGPEVEGGEGSTSGPRNGASGAMGVG